MRKYVRQARHCVSALAVAVVVLGFVTDSAYAQRRGRGRMSIPIIPPRPANITSGPMIDGLNKALRTLEETDLDYDGHVQKAINHIHAAIRDLGVPNAKGGSNGSGAKKPAAKAGTTDQGLSDAIVHKTLTQLFTMHHKLADHGATVGRLHADAEVRIAISELGLALKSSAPKPTKATTASTPAKTGK